MTKNKMDKEYKNIHLAAAVSAMFFIVVSLLLTSFQIAVYIDPDYRFYEKEYVKYNVTESLQMSLEDVMDVTEYMMDYLIGREGELSVETEVDGKSQDFFNEQDRLHMADVRNLFLGGLKLRTVFAVAAFVLFAALVFMRADIKKLLIRAYGIAMAVFAAALVFLGTAFTIDFTKCFTIFHELFFTNDLWLFDPDTDYMIRMLPEGFFSDMVIRIAVVFLCGLVILGILVICVSHGLKKFSDPVER